MDIQMLTTFFMWCTILNGGLLVFWGLWCLIAPDLVYRIQSRFYPMPRETWNPIMYGFLGFFKIMFLVFVLIPYLALLIVG
jgi:hypothetical protein